MESLPDEILLDIAQYFTLPGLAHFAMICRRARNIAHDPALPLREYLALDPARVDGDPFEMLEIAIQSRASCALIRELTSLVPHEVEHMIFLCAKYGAIDAMKFFMQGAGIDHERMSAKLAKHAFFGNADVMQIFFPTQESTIGSYLAHRLKNNGYVDCMSLLCAHCSSSVPTEVFVNKNLLKSIEQGTCEEGYDYQHVHMNARARVISYVTHPTIVNNTFAHLGEGIKTEYLVKMYRIATKRQILWFYHKHDWLQARAGCTSKSDPATKLMFIALFHKDLDTLHDIWKHVIMLPVHPATLSEYAYYLAAASNKFFYRMVYKFGTPEDFAFWQVTKFSPDDRKLQWPRSMRKCVAFLRTRSQNKLTKYLRESIVSREYDIACACLHLMDESTLSFAVARICEVEDVQMMEYVRRHFGATIPDID